MPTPIEILMDPVSIVVLALYGGLMIWEAVAAGRVLPEISGWKVRGLTAFVVFFYLSSYLPLWWDKYLAEYQLVDLTWLGTLGGTIVGLLVYELGVYAWHRTMHNVDFLWRAFHQMHHSVERLDTYSAFYFSPLDMIGWTFLGSFCLTLVVGLTPQAATAILLLTTFFAMFTHSNIRTPRWLGYIIQRPEAHAIHHGRGIHAYNYSDLPVFDMAFGTFRNPETYENETGFYDGASARVGDMLAFRDVSEPGPRRRREAGAKT